MNHTLKYEFRMHGFWFMHCDCGERFIHLRYAKALAKFLDHIPREDIMSDQNDEAKKVTTERVEETSTLAPDLTDHREEHRVPDASEAVEQTTTETVVTEQDVPHGAGGDNPADAQPEDAEPDPISVSPDAQPADVNPTPDSSNEESTDATNS